MSATTSTDAYGVLTEPETLTIRRFLPASVEQVWAYLTDGELRRQWLADGDMDKSAGSRFELVWRNDELSGTPSGRPDNMPAECRMQSEIIEWLPHRRLTISWQGGGDVSFELEPRGAEVLLTVIHRRLADRKTKLDVGAGWHVHLDLLVACLAGSQRASFWETWARLRAEYDRRIPL